MLSSVGAWDVGEDGVPEERDLMLEGQVLHPEVAVVLSALRFELNIGWSRHPTGRCATVGLCTFGNT